MAGAAIGPHAGTEPRRSAQASRLVVEPDALVLDGPRARAQLLVTLRRADGTQLDVTDRATYTSNSLVTISKGFLQATGKGNGPARIRIAYREGKTGLTSSVTVRITGAESERPISFLNEVIPALTQAGCNSGACHGAQHGRGGFRLSLLGYDPDADYDAIVHDSGGRRMNRSAPEQGLILAKPTGLLPHGGGLRLRTGSEPLTVLRQWLSEGAPAPIAGERQVVALQATPSQRVVRKQEGQRLRVVAKYSDGSTEDVTSRARFNTNNDGVATVSDDGLARGVGSGEAAMMVRYQGQVTVVRIAVPFPPPAGANAVALPSSEAPGLSLIDREIRAGWKRLGLVPTPRSSDAEFARRLHLDTIGTLPDPDRVAAFVADKSPDKRAKLVDEVLARPEWVDFWTLYFGDILRNNRTTVGEKGMWGLRSWIADSLRGGKPYNRMVAELIDVSGSTYRNPAGNYYSIAQTPEDLAETTSQVLLGIRLNCARCHNHPFEKWSQADYYGFAAFFARVKIKGFPAIGAFGGDQLILTAPDGEVLHPKSKKAVLPHALDSTTTLERESPRLKALAAWLADPANPFVGRNIVNRIWGRLMGRGLIHPVDDVRASNPASLPGLLDALTAEFARSNFDLKHLMRTILTSEAYSLGSMPTKQNAPDERFYSRYFVRRLTAEQLLDALCDVTGVPEKFPNLPVGTRAISLPDTTVRSYFLDTFGRPLRAAVCECERDPDPNLTQVLHLGNSEFLQSKITATTGRLARLIEAKKSDADIITEFYRRAFSRPPEADELSTAMKLLSSAPNRKEGLEDLVWTVLNSKEFLLNH